MYAKLTVQRPKRTYTIREGDVEVCPGAPVAPVPHGLLEDPRTHQALLLLGGILVVFARLWETTLASYDDTYYAEKAKEILLTGDWLVPHWNLQPTFDNTPLYAFAASKEVAELSPQTLVGVHYEHAQSLRALGRVAESVGLTVATG